MGHFCICLAPDFESLRILCKWFLYDQPFVMDGTFRHKWLFEVPWVTNMRIKPRTTNFELRSLTKDAIPYTAVVLITVNVAPGNNMCCERVNKLHFQYLFHLALGLFVILLLLRIFSLKKQDTNKHMLNI